MTNFFDVKPSITDEAELQDDSVSADPQPGDNLADIALRMTDTISTGAKDFTAALASTLRAGGDNVDPHPGKGRLSGSQQHAPSAAQPLAQFVSSPIAPSITTELAEEERVRALAPPMQGSGRAQAPATTSRPLVHPPTPAAAAFERRSTPAPNSPPAHHQSIDDGKSRAPGTSSALHGTYPSRNVSQEGPDDSAGAWWLDIQLPTYRTMVEISKMFPLHPLTVEDVLQQEAREKVESFDSLGYYFVVVRAPVDPLPSCLQAPFAPSHIPMTASSHTTPSGAAQLASAAVAAGASPGSLVPTPDKLDAEKLPSSTDTSSGAAQTSRPLSPEVAKTSWLTRLKRRVVPSWWPRQWLRSRSSDQGDEIEMQEEKASPTTSAGHVRATDDDKDKKDGTGPGLVADGGVLSVANLYLVVFSHGVISFHFDDLSVHTNRVLQRLVHLSQPVDLTSDWIVHGLVDSIVDTIFPLLTRVETLIQAFEEATAGPIDPSAQPSDNNFAQGIKGVSTLEHGRGSVGDLPLYAPLVRQMRLVYSLRKVSIPLPQWLAQRLPVSCVQQAYRMRRPPGKLAQLGWWGRRASGAIEADGDERVSQKRGKKEFQTAQAASALLRGMTDVRRTLLGLMRLMVPKNDALRTLRNRIDDTRASSVARIEVAMYLGDVHDHVLSLLAAFQSAESTLSDLHSGFQTAVVLYNRQIRQKMTREVLFLATVAIMCMAGTWVCSIFGMNVLVPFQDNGSYIPFGVILVIVFLTQVCIWNVYRFWMHQAQRRLNRSRAAR